MSGIYLHIPFCESKCRYCDFFSLAGRNDLIPAFLTALKQEITLHRDWFPSGSEEVGTVYFGGGTPSLLNPGKVKEIISLLRDTFSVSPGAEISLEANPSCISGRYLKNIRESGITRLSLGVQSFRDPECILLGRRHTAAQGAAALAAAKEAGFSSVGIDLIYGIPGQTVRQWLQTLEQAVALAPDHISAYSLTWRNGSPLGCEIECGRLPAPRDGIIARMYLEGARVLRKAGYEHYEISNFCLPGHACRHNQGYWDGSPYLGLGPSAHSFKEPIRHWNIPDVIEYCTVLSHGSAPLETEEVLTAEELHTERIGLGLRTSSGLPLAEAPAAAGLLTGKSGSTLAVLSEGRIRLTDRGFLLADEIASRLMQ